MNILIAIMKEDIEGSRPNNPNHCAVARSLRRHFPGADVRVSHHYDIQSGPWYAINITNYTTTLSTSLTGDVYQKVREFDSTGRMEPFSFPITL